MRRFDPKRHRLPAFESDAILLVDKPATWTSFDVVNFVRSRFNIPKVGHCGTLDPAATGLLVLVLGKFTRLSGALSGVDKIYEAKLTLGIETDSEDMDGEIIRRSDCSNITEDMLRETIASFMGKSMQVPPMVSALKKDGKKLYELARAGKEVEREPRPIEIFDIKPTAIALPDCEFTVHCSKGTYVRTIASDIGRKLGCGAVLSGLRRTQAGKFSIEDAVTVDTLKTFEQAQLKEFVEKFLYGKALKIAAEAARNQ
ncbi:MAG: tRNA pseudouridine(55) synthase TruB [Lentisphaeria bacterium]|nr:tRNA pseudouridine(55) synthase TruB [Lentisphaerota bacterium]MBR7143626.1 tRNA pseudouridine(55) synthase TruB [Lentisphaeria bacterium]